MNALAALPFAAFLEGRARRRPWIIGSLAIVRIGHLGLIAVPYLAGEWAPGAAVLPGPVDRRRVLWRALKPGALEGMQGAVRPG